MALPASGAISLNDVNVELGLSATAQISLNDAAVRGLFGIGSGAISMSNGYGKANEFPFTISSNQTNANLATLATNAGWNGTSKVVVTINSGIYISSNNTGTPALTIPNSFPGGVELINNGIIVGMGGAGGAGRNISNRSGYGGSAGGNGGGALSVSATTSIQNNGTIAGGGGGGGGGGAAWNSGITAGCGGGGGGGRSSLAANSSGGARGVASGVGYPGNGGVGNAGTVSSQGSGGARGSAYMAQYNFRAYGGAGGAGGAWGANGTKGNNPGIQVNIGNGFSGGSGGYSVSGNSYITWLATGTRLGSIS